MVVETKDAVLVVRSPREVKEVVRGLARNRSEHYSRVYRPGVISGVDAGEHFGQAPDDQAGHSSRAVASPAPNIGSWCRFCHHAQRETFVLERNQSTYIPVGVKHRIGNTTAERLLVVEVQSGAYLGEDDIVRFEDRYKRE